MRQRFGLRIFFAVGVLVGSLALLGCATQPEVTPAPPAAVAPAPPPAPTPAPTPIPPPAEAPVAPRPTPRAEVTPYPLPTMPTTPSTPPTPAPAAAPLKDVFFDFDRDNIRDDQKARLSDNVAWLKANPRAKITVEGHCDERGTSEYNLGLGKRRATATKDYLVSAGIAPDRIATISYGEERPFVLGHDESAWKWNRRGHFVSTEQ
jgi:peptidoglycan-associated lipoprotein